MAIFAQKYVGIFTVYILCMHRTYPKGEQRKLKYYEYEETYLVFLLTYVANAQILFNLPSLCVFVVSKRCIVQRVQKPKYLYQEEEAYRFKVP